MIMILLYEFEQVDFFFYVMLVCMLLPELAILAPHKQHRDVFTLRCFVVVVFFLHLSKWPQWASVSLAITEINVL